MKSATVVDFELTMRRQPLVEVQTSGQVGQKIKLAVWDSEKAAG